MATHSYENLLIKGTGITESQLGAILTTSTKDGGLIQEKLEGKNFKSPDEALAIVCKELDIEFLKDIDTDPRVLGLYLYAGTPMPISYAEGFLGYFFKKEYKKN